MPSVGENLRTFIVNSTGVIAQFPSTTTISDPAVVEQNTMRQDAPSPRIWYQRASQEQDVGADGELLITDSSWDIEVHSDDLDQGLDIADAVKTRLNGHFGRFGSTASSTADKVHGVYVEDHDDDYEPQGVASEEGVYVSSLSARILF